MATGDVVLWPAEPVVGDIKLRVGESLVSGAVHTVAVADAVTAADAPTGLVTVASARSDALSVGETETASADFAGNGVDAITATETATTTALFVAAVAESGNGADSSTGLVTFPVAVSESLTASDAETGVGAFAGAAPETLAAVESEAVTAAFVATMPETVTASDSEAAQADFVTAQAESLAASDSQDATLAGPPVVYDVAVDDVLAVTDACDATVGPPQTSTPVPPLTGGSRQLPPRRRVHASETHAGTVADRRRIHARQDATAVFGGAVEEALIPSDRVEGRLIARVALRERVSARDGCDATVAYAARALDRLALVDDLDAMLVPAPGEKPLRHEPPSVRPWSLAGEVPDGVLLAALELLELA